jgi:hypothetical protein
MDIFFTRVEIAIINCPPELEGAEVEYSDSELLLSGVVENGKLVVETSDEIPEGTTIQWGKGRWVINW